MDRRPRAPRRGAAASLAAGEVEIGAERAPLILEALPEELQPVGREELAQPSVGEQALMRRVADGLELVQCSGSGGIVRRELVDDEQVAAGPGHAGELGDDEIGPRDVMERPVCAREVEGSVGKGESSPVSRDELRVRQGACACELEQLGHRVESDDRPHERRDRERQRAGPRPDVEGEFVAARPGEVPHLLRELRGAGILPRRDAFRRAREAASHAGLSA